MKVTIELSPKALDFIETRKKDLTTGQYISHIMENIHDQTILPGTVTDGYDLLELVEGKNSKVPKDTLMFKNMEPNGWREASIRPIVADVPAQIFDYLSAVYKDRIPRAIFIKKCLERGLDMNETEIAVMRYKDKIVR